MKATEYINLEETEETIKTKEITVEDIVLEITFECEKGHKHSRFIKLNSDCTDLTKIKIKEEIGKHNILKNFE